METFTACSTIKTFRYFLGAQLVLSALLLSILNSHVSTAAAQGTAFKLLTTLTNPTPAAYDRFGCWVAAVGTDKVLIGAMPIGAFGPNTEAVHLFSTNGTLLTIFTNPTPAYDDQFGNSVTAVGSDKVLIGAHLDNIHAADDGAAYLFNTSGGLLTTFTNPTPATADQFGYSVAAVGADKVIIGARWDDTNAKDAGAAYLFNTNGTLLTTFTNPTPSLECYFGNSVAALGADRVLVGARSVSKAYLLSTNGTLLTTFTSPVPRSYDGFGDSIAVVSSDKVLIGAPGASMGASGAGAAYLFNTNGTLLTTFANPSPAPQDFFGLSVAAVSSDKVLISAHSDNTGATDAGAAYLFNTNGTLLITFTNPTPQSGDSFGISVATVGPEKAIIGAHWDNTGATGAGTAYLFNFGPLLSISHTATNGVTLSWSSPWRDFSLQQSSNGLAAVNWSNVLVTPIDNGTNKTVIIDPPTGNRFYRLSKP